MEPTDAGGRFSRAGIFFILCWNLKLPALWRGLRDDKWERRLGELKDRPPIGMSRDQKFSGNFGRHLFRPPNRLALLNFPPRFGEIRRGEWPRVASAQKNGEREKAESLHLYEKGWNRPPACSVRRPSDRKGKASARSKPAFLVQAFSPLRPASGRAPQAGGLCYRVRDFRNGS